MLNIPSMLSIVIKSPEVGTVKIKSLTLDFSPKLFSQSPLPSVEKCIVD